jgi:hypothetical protein
MRVSMSFNLSDEAREILKESAKTAGLSEGKFIDHLVAMHSGPIMFLTKRSAGTKGGSPSAFRKRRGTTTCPHVAPETRKRLEELTVHNSRGDVIEYLLRRFQAMMKVS